MKRYIPIVAAICILAINVFPYGSRGHALVGRIADNRLASEDEVLQKIRSILHNVTLEKAANIPDSIKSWDKCKPNETPGTNPVVSDSEINDQLRAFLNANPCMGPSGHPYHRNFHFTNIPVEGNELYDDGTVGRPDDDIVNMITYSVKVLQNEIPENNRHAITKAVAIILIAHYVGDLHQPLHAAAQYFDSNGRPFNPSAGNPGHKDNGGNKLTLFTFQNKKLRQAGKNMHAYWDGQPVENAFGDADNSTIASLLASTEPSDWELQGAVATWSKQMANAMMPVSREAYSRLAYKRIQIKPTSRSIVGGRAEERKRADKQYYARWAHGVAKEQIHKGGWRLAELLKRIFANQ